ncbi:MAG: CDGSH iron-sulfur domain-containing protein [Bacteroidota bacterium]
MEEMIPNAGFPKLAADQPCGVTVEAGKTYAWCTCGLSEKQPFCDGRHKKIEGNPFASQRFTAEETKEVWLCRCKKTKKPPYCDGSHNNP